jgi:hypothetical protein
MVAFLRVAKNRNVIPKLQSYGCTIIGIFALLGILMVFSDWKLAFELFVLADCRSIFID